jgi:CheY-like chemotaxis protein
MPNEHILVVDDHEANLKLAAAVLQWEGYRVSRAIDAEQALLVIRESPPDLILLDIALPRMDGLTFTRLLKSDPATSQIPVIAFTAFAMKSDEQKAVDAGFDGYIAKPFDSRSLSEKVAGYLKAIPPS